MSKLYNPDYLKHLCLKYKLTPSRRYGQNFLIEPEVIEKILTVAGLKAEETVVEVGPGFGVLTLALAEKVKKVVAFEIEKKLAPYWEEKIKQHKNIQIVWGNILKQVESYSARGGSAFGGKVVANLPYQITSAVIRLFLENANPPELMVLMAQKEVAERICARPGDMSLLSVAVQYYADPEMVATVPRTNFWPEPRVDSAIIKLSLRGVRQLADDEAIPRDRHAPSGLAMTSEFFFKIVKAGFSSRRKMLIKNLAPLCGKNKAKLRDIFSKIGLNEKVRAQELSVEQWRQLVEVIHTYFFS